jgi:SAM-dependent methyltransferase
MCDDAGRIIALYERHAQHWDRNRWRNLFERAWLARFRTLLPTGGSVLDIGCGSGEPIARHFIEAGYKLTGVDSSRAMIAFCKARFQVRLGWWKTCALCQLTRGSTESSPGTASFISRKMISV